MYRDLEGEATGRHYSGDNVAYGEDRRGWLIGETSNGILEGWWFYVYYLTHPLEVLRNPLRTLTGGAQ